MTEHEKGAAKFAESLGGIEGHEKVADKWEKRSDESHSAAMATNDAIRRSHEDQIEARANDKARAERYEARHEKEWAQDDERHRVWLDDVKHCQATRERDAAALERIATALEQGKTLEFIADGVGALVQQGNHPR